MILSLETHCIVQDPFCVNTSAFQDIQNECYTSLMFILSVGLSLTS